MSLINPTPGELLDRQTILHLKIEAARRRGLDDGHFQDELRAIQAALAGWFAKPAGADRRAYDDAARELADLNRKLWHAEDEVRALAASQRDRLAELAKLIPALNDQRAAAVERVNHLFGVSRVEKMYQ